MKWKQKDMSVHNSFIKYWRMHVDNNYSFNAVIFITIYLRINSIFFSFHWDIQKCALWLFHSYLNEMKKNQLSVLIIFLYEFLIKLTLSAVIYAILAVFNHSVAHNDLGWIQKNETASCITHQSVVPIEPNRHSANIWLRGMQKKKKKKRKSVNNTFPGRFLWQVRFTLLFPSRNGSMAVPISHFKIFFKACLQNKRVVRQLFGSILILYTIEVS